MFTSELFFVGVLKRVKVGAGICLLFLVSHFPTMLSAASVTLAWDPSPDSTVVNYVVRYSTTSGIYNSFTNAGLATTATVSGVQAATPYFFAVFAVNGTGLESLPSNEVGYTIPALAAPLISSVPNQSVAEDASTSVAFTVSSAAVPAANLTLSATSSNPSLIPPTGIVFGGSGSNRTATLTPVPNRSGTATLTFMVSDGTLTTTRAFLITVNPVNDAPTADPLAARTLGEDSGTQTVALSGLTSGASDEAQTLLVTAVSSNPSLIPNPTVNYVSPNASGSLSFVPVANASGTATVTVTVNDGQAANNVVTRSFLVTVTAVNDAPTLNALGSVNLATDAGLQTISLSGISSGAGNESQALSVTATSSNPNLVPNPAVSYTSPNSTGSLSFTPIAGGSGVATITVTVSDGQSQNATVSRTLTVAIGVPAASTFYVEAEDGLITAPMTIATDSTAAGGQYIYAETDYQGTANYALNITETGDYVVWCRVLSVDSGTDSFFVSMDGAAEASYATAQNIWFTNWQWTLVNQDAVSARVFPLAAGAHTLTFRGRERLTKLDAIYITTDRNFVPGGRPGNVAPTLNALANLTLNEDAGTQVISLGGISAGATNETQILTVTAVSSNPGLIPNPLVAYTSPGSTGTLTFTPALNANGTSTITTTVNDGQSSNNTIVRTFTVTVNSVNDSPAISAIPDLSIVAGTSLPLMTFTVTDLETAPGNLTLAATSSNPLLVPVTGIVFGGAGSTRSLLLTPNPGLSGSTTISVIVTDANGGTATENFLLMLANSPPTISSIANQALVLNIQLGPIGFTVGDLQTAVGSLALSATSSNPTLVPNGSILFGGSGANRSLNLTPALDQIGTTTITLVVSDGALIAQRTFTVTVTPPPLMARSFTNSALIMVPSGGKASLYPSPIAVGGMFGGISNLSVTLRGIDHSYPDDLDVLLVGPQGQSLLLMSDVGSGRDARNVTLTLSDAAQATLPDKSQLVSGTFTPRNFGTGDVMPTPAPAPPYSSQLSVFNGSSANGTWSLYIFDDRSGDSGTLAHWSLSITTTNSGSATPFSLAANMGEAPGDSIGLGEGLSATMPAEGEASTLELQPGKFSSGTYRGLFHASDAVRLESSGELTLSVTDRGAYTGNLRTSAGTMSFNGQFDSLGHATNVLVQSGSTSVVVRFLLDEGDDKLAGEVSGLGWRAALVGDRAEWDRVGNPAAAVGVHSLRMVVEANTVMTGENTMQLTVGSDGTATLAGKLADGTTFTHRTSVSSEGDVPLFASLYGGNGLLIGWLRVADGAVSGSVRWIRSAPTSETNPTTPEFSLEGTVLGTLHWSLPSLPIQP